MTERAWRLSWFHERSHGAFELHSPWWYSGLRVDDDASPVVAAVRAVDGEAAKAIVAKAYDTPPAAIEWRFCDEMPAGTSPFSERFQRFPWMVWEDR